MCYREISWHGILLGLGFALCSCTTGGLAEIDLKQANARPASSNGADHDSAVWDHDVEMPYSETEAALPDLWNRIFPPGAVYGHHDFRQATDSNLVSLGQSTVALFLEKDLQASRKSGWKTLAKWLEGRCFYECGAELQKVQDAIGHLPVGAIASGVIVGHKVIVMTRHTATRYKDSLQEFRVVFGFEGRADKLDLQSFAVERVCYPKDGPTSDYALVRLDVPSHEGLPAIQPVERTEDAVSKAQKVLAFGHPLGSARVVTGGNNHTYIKNCGKHIRASLDSLERSSGSPVFIPSRDVERDWILFGLIFNAPKHDLFGNPVDISRVDAPPEQNFCVNDGEGVGPWIVPLRFIEENTIKEFSDKVDPKGWCCHSPGDRDTRCDI